MRPLLLAVALLSCPTQSLVTPRRVQYRRGSSFLRPPRTAATENVPMVELRGGGGRSSTTVLLLIANPGILSVLAGSAAGAIGVGVAFPFDTIKTKAQVMSRPVGHSDGSAAITVEKIGLFRLIRLVWKREGLAGFFGGVKGMMAGQALIKALAFSANANALLFLDANEITRALPTTVILLTAACFSGFVTSFLVTPVERIKLMLQAQSAGTYRNELECARAIIRSEGWTGLMTRGLGVTLSREIPSYGIYFWIYGFLMQSLVGRALPIAVAPLICGGLSGMASWLPVYPVDVVKTTLQNTEGSKGDASSWEVVKDLYKNGGVGAFFDGLDAKMLRAAVNHAVTFFVYDMIMRNLSG